VSLTMTPASTTFISCAVAWSRPAVPRARRGSGQGLP
jgi:hypothetical protein